MHDLLNQTRRIDKANGIENNKQYKDTRPIGKKYYRIILDGKEIIAHSIDIIEFYLPYQVYPIGAIRRSLGSKGFFEKDNLKITPIELDDDIHKDHKFLVNKTTFEIFKDGEWIAGYHSRTAFKDNGYVADWHFFKQQNGLANQFTHGGYTVKYRTYRLPTMIPKVLTKDTVWPAIEGVENLGSFKVKRISPDRKAVATTTSVRVLRVQITNKETGKVHYTGNSFELSLTLGEEDTRLLHSIFIAQNAKIVENDTHIFEVLTDPNHPYVKEWRVMGTTKAITVHDTQGVFKAGFNSQTMLKLNTVGIAPSDIPARGSQRVLSVIKRDGLVYTIRRYEKSVCLPKDITADHVLPDPELYKR